MSQMMIEWKSVARICVVVFALLPMTGCLSLGSGTQDPARFYMLSSMDVAGGAQRANPVSFSICVGPVSVPEHLNRPQMVRRIGDNQVEFAEFSLWAEPLQENITRVLMENLSVLLSTDQVCRFPGNSDLSPDVRVSVDVVRFDAGPESGAVVEARWVAVRGGDVEGAERQSSRVEGKVVADDPAEVVAAYSRALEQISRDIAGKILEL
jgi:uncharacterized lipoprotein YmbA